MVGVVAHGPDVETFVLGKMAFGDGAEMRRDTVEDLLTFRCGLGMIVAPPGRYPIQKAIANLGVNGVGFGPPDPAMPVNGDVWIKKISSLPLFAQPGEDWLYTAGSNIQGVLVERASDQPLSRVFEDVSSGRWG